MASESDQAAAETINVSPRVVMFTAPNPGPKTLSGTHTYLVGRESAYVIDPGPEIGEYQTSLANWIHQDGTQVKALLLTHSHPDHAPGARLLGNLLGVPVLSSASMPAETARALGSDALLEDGVHLPVDGDVLEVIATPGHAPDHIALWLRNARLLFAGDTILGEGTSLIAPPEGDMRLYMQTLGRLALLEPLSIAPGHGPVVLDARAKIEEYLSHRREREAQIVEALKAGPATIEELVRRVYATVDPKLQPLAAGSVQAQLLKLEAEGKIQERDGSFTLTDSTG